RVATPPPLGEGRIGTSEGAGLPHRPNPLLQGSERVSRPIPQRSRVRRPAAARRRRPAPTCRRSQTVARPSCCAPAVAANGRRWGLARFAPLVEGRGQPSQQKLPKRL